MTEQVACAVVGAGVVGLAVARALAAAGLEVVVLEAAASIGTVTSSRNSEVIHAGLYYPLDSLKARLCRRGRSLLYRYLASRGIDHLKCGKLVVACDKGEVAGLQRIEANGRANGVDDLRRLTGEEAAALEPQLRCVAALLSPSTGIFDSHAFMLALAGEAEAAGALFAFLSPCRGGRIVPGGIVLDVGGTTPTTLMCRRVVNCAGLGAQALARAIAGFPAALVPQLHYAKGNYFTLTGRPPFSRLIYPLPDQASVGLHYTRDLAGRGRFGPDVEWVEEIDYRVDDTRADRFVAAIRRYWPQLPDGSLLPGYAGVRPKLQAPGEPPRDFVIQGPETHGVDGLIHLFGIESPGLTASLAIAEHVATRFGLPAPAI
jgi:L-2-hydroxyglutarate oxidase LhgO